jgi:hypothetical protein
MFSRTFFNCFITSVLENLNFNYVFESFIDMQKTNMPKKLNRFQIKAFAMQVNQFHLFLRINLNKTYETRF